MRKTRVFVAMALAMMLFGGCGTTANNLGGATDGYNDAVYGNNYGNGTNGGLAYWDGYGVNDGRTVTGNDRTNNTERNSYGMRTDGWDVGNRVQRAADALTDTRTNTMVN